MIDLKKLEKQREVACQDKSDLFDFYNYHWDSLTEEIASLRAELLVLRRRNG